MNLLGAKLYDPAVAVLKATTALLAMTVIDNANLRNAVTVPAHGMLRFRIMCAIHGAITCPQIMLGVMNGAAVLGRVAPVIYVSNLAATSRYVALAEFVVTGLAPGAMNCDVAYGVETLVAATNIKYGGPQSAAADDAFGGFVFEVWDPQPIADISARLPAALVGGRMDSSVGAMANNVLTAAAINADAITDAKVAADVTVASVTGSVGSVTGNVGGNVVGSVGSVTAATTVGTINANVVNASALAADAATEIATAVWAAVARTLTANPGLDAAAVRAALGMAAANLDTQLAADPAGVTTLLSRLTAGRATNLDNLDAAVSSRLATVGYTAPNNAGIATAAAAAADTTAIKAKTDSLTFTLAAKLDVNILAVNGVVVTGTGAPGSRWGP